MKELTSNNHLRISPGVLIRDGNKFDYSVIDIGDPTPVSKNPLELAIDAAREIFEKSNSSKPINLFLSGGLDSECMLIAFIRSKVPFKVVCVKFTNDLNRHDILDLYMLCKKYQITPQVIDFDIINFYESGKHFELAEKYRCRSPQFTAYFEFLKMSDATAVMAWQPLKIQTVDGQMSLILPDDSSFSFSRFISDCGISATPFFFLYTPNLIAAFLKRPFLHKFQTDFQGRYCYEFKVFQYQTGGFAVDRRANKYTGFELVKEFYRLKDTSHPDPFNQIYRIPLENAYPIPYPIYRHSKLYFEEL